MDVSFPTSPSISTIAIACAIAGVVSGTLTGCTAPTPGADVVWTPDEALNATLPSGIQVFRGESARIPLRAWVVALNPTDASVDARVVVSDDGDAREVGTSIANDLDACVVVNGGYFRMDTAPSRHVGLLIDEHRIVEPATNGVLRGDLRYPTSRAALGLFADGSAEITWVTSRNDTTWTWPSPSPNRRGLPSEAPDYREATPWPVRFALSGGPALIVNGEVRITSDEEVFFDTSIPDVHPRTAAGLTADGQLLLMVVDGRQPFSRGVDLPELALLMKDMGAVDALNLDGGGSSTLVINGQLINRPSGSTIEREIMSAIAVFCHHE